MKHLPRPLELLAPARDAEVARQAILHGADAVYIGAASHGARSAAANSIDDIRGLVEFAHNFRARVYVTVNTIVYDRELADVQRLITDLYHAGVDALIVQDMGILRLDIPPIQLHASTQCDIATPEKARFLQDVGFSQLVLARELTLEEIREVCRKVTVPVECFVHGALCVSYSGRCHASQACGGRSANRGECAQICRLPYTLKDADGRVLARDKYLLSMHDLNASHSLEQMVDAGVSSFKIEGRLKDVAYVKNITAYYRQLLDDIIARNPDKYVRSSFGESEIAFDPNPEKSFNRGYTDFCLTSGRGPSLASLHTPKSLGERIDDVSQLNNGDGIAWIEKGVLTGSRVNRIDHGRIITADSRRIPPRAHLRRTFDVKWEQTIARNTADRRIDVDMKLYDNRLEISDSRGVSAVVPLNPTTDVAKSGQSRRRVFEKLGTTIYRLRDFEDNVDAMTFIPNSELADLRRRGIETLDRAARASYPFRYRDKEDAGAVFPTDRLDYRANVANRLARQFYEQHGVRSIEPAMEITPGDHVGKTVMTSRHCILRQLGYCPKRGGRRVSLPLRLVGQRSTFRIATDCDRCEMRIIKE